MLNPRNASKCNCNFVLPIRSRIPLMIHGLSFWDRIHGDWASPRAARQSSGKSASSPILESRWNIAPRDTILPSFVRFVVPHKNCQLPSVSWLTSKMGCPFSNTGFVVKEARFLPSWNGQVLSSERTG